MPRKCMGELLFCIRLVCFSPSGSRLTVPKETVATTHFTAALGVRMNMDIAAAQALTAVVGMECPAWRQCLDIAARPPTIAGMGQSSVDMVVGLNLGSVDFQLLHRWHQQAGHRLS